MSKLEELLADADDLGAWRTALVREYSIRQAMAETGEDRQTIVNMVDASESMDQEAVLDLTSGAPTTLTDGLQAYIESLDAAEEGSKVGVDGVINHLHALLMYPWPEEEAVIGTHADNAHIGLRVDSDAHQTVVFVGGQEVARADRDDNTLPSVEATAEAVHRAVLARVIGDRPHHIQINSSNLADLIRWLDRPNGSWSADYERLTVDAVEGGGVMIRTRPYAYVVPPRSRA